MGASGLEGKGRRIAYLYTGLTALFPSSQHFPFPLPFLPLIHFPPYTPPPFPLPLLPSSLPPSPPPRFPLPLPPCRWVLGALEAMQQSSAAAARIALAHGCTSCTDVTGFGLLGHLVEMARPSKV